jgi:sec-independent protein translocase protein TatC
MRGTARVTDAASPPHDPPLPLTEHLRELRKRLMIAVTAVAVGFGICYAFAEELFGYLLLPVREVIPADRGDLVFTNLTEPFVVYLKTGLLGGVMLAMPVILMQVWLFVRPAFRDTEERWTTVFVALGSILFVVGSLFGYFVVFPFGFSFLVKIAGAEFLPMLSIREYFSLATRMLMAFGIMFETPLVLLMLGRMGVVDAAMLRRYRRHAIVVIFIVGAVLTPPDVVTQVLMALPLMLLFEMSIALVAMFGRPRRVAE